MCGASVILTDKEEYPKCLKNCQHSCDVNGQHSVKVVGITWGQFTPNLFRLPKVDIILGSDCFYDTKGTQTSIMTIFNQGDPHCQKEIFSGALQITIKLKTINMEVKIEIKMIN